MGTQNKRFGAIRDLSLIESRRMQLQTAIDNGKSIESRKRFGQFATPYELAQEIMSFGLTLQDKKEISFLEPAFGTGAFYSALLSECDKQAKIINTAIGVEVDKDFYTAANELWGCTNLNLVNGDFTEIESFENVNLLISNPPYVRHHYINKEQKSKLSTMTQKETGLSLSGLAGLYCYFILSAHKWLAPDAICGWLIPSEFMDVNYGGKLKEYLLNKVHLLRVHRYNPENCKFDDALVSSCVVWFKNEIMENNYDVEFSYGGTLEKPEVSRNVDRNTLVKSRKWTRFPTNYGNLLSAHAPTLGDFFTIKRGLATGDNDFFILSKEKIEELNLDMNFFTPILPSPRYLKCNEVFSDKYGNPCLDTQYFLLNCTLPEEEVKKNHPSIWNYLSSGIDTTAQKYLCKNRKVWYYQENRSATPFLCSYMGRRNDEHATPFRFILNHTSAIATNSYLMLYPKATLQETIAQTPDILYEVWNALNNITANDLESEGRVYGGGLKKIEPKELSYVKCPRLVEGIAEKLLMPLFMELCGCPYEDEHISIVEIGGKHFGYFVELFNGNAVKKKVLCITDNDFKWIDFDEDGKLRSYADYEEHKPTHIVDLKERFPIDNLYISTQKAGGRTFEDEFFITNLQNKDVATIMFRKAISNAMDGFFNTYGLDIAQWEANFTEIEGRSSKTIGKYLDAYKERVDSAPEKNDGYANIIFAQLFLHYVKNKKGDFALDVLTNKELINKEGSSKIVVPKYIEEGLQWLLK